MRRGCRDFVCAVYHQVSGVRCAIARMQHHAIRSEAETLARQAAQALDVIRVPQFRRIWIQRLDAFDAMRFKDDDISTPWPAEIISHAVHEQMVAADHAQLYELIAGLHLRPGKNPAALEQ